MLTLADNPDPLGILRTTLPIAQHATSVTIDFDAIGRVAQEIANGELILPEWDSDLHWHDDPDATAMFIFVLDALNFCFWGEPRWSVLYRGRSCNGYVALAAALTRSMQDGIPLTDPFFLLTVDESTVAHLLAGHNTIPLLSERVANLQEVGRVLIDQYAGSFANLLDSSNHSAIKLVTQVVTLFSSFNDITTYEGHEIRFYKRAQILASDLASALQPYGRHLFYDLPLLTAFADYKVPQVLHHLNVLRYDSVLSHILQTHTEIPPGHPLELEIRAGTVWAIEILSRELRSIGSSISPYHLDSVLWQLGQSLPADALPYHRTRTIYY